MELIVVRPYRAVAFIFGCITVVLMIVCLSASTWLLSDGLRQGLWIYCVENNLRNPETLPPTYTDVSYGCHGLVNPPNGMFKIALLGCSLLFFIGTLMLGFVLFTDRVDKKRLFLVACLAAYVVSTFMLIGGLVLLPVKFYLELASWKRNHWEFGWAFGVAWGAALFLVAALVLLLCFKTRTSSLSSRQQVGSGNNEDGSLHGKRSGKQRAQKQQTQHRASSGRAQPNYTAGTKKKNSRTPAGGDGSNSSRDAIIYAEAPNS